VPVFGVIALVSVALAVWFILSLSARPDIKNEASPTVIR